MPAKKPKVDIIFHKEIAIILKNLASKEHKSISHLTKELVLEALMYCEAISMASIAKMCDAENIKLPVP